MTIHPSDPRYIAQRLGSTKCWREIGALVAERARHRLAVLEERRDWLAIQRNVGMEE
jgi:hypothetical protein